MVERLKAAIEKARASRAPEHAPEHVAPHAASQRPKAPAGAFDALERRDPDPQVMIRNHIVTRDRSDPSYAAFDILRTRLVQSCADKGWSKIGVTSPTKNSGKTTVALNLAFSLDRLTSARTLLVDFDLAAPSLASRLGLSGARRIADFLTGEQPAERAFERLGDNLAVAFNDTVEHDPAERLYARSTRQFLAAAATAFSPTMMLFDLPPVLSGDSMMAAARHLDAVLMVAAAGLTTAAQLEESAHLIKDHTQILGVVLNRCEDIENSIYEYGDA